ncbi:MAG: endo-1,4-beta-xylanase [Lachnospiraceae bacterium]|nr:endo-1,4-beta-xylanase [Lachnospiraceae bacterium]
MKRRIFCCVICFLMVFLTGCGAGGVRHTLPAQEEVTSKTLQDVFGEHGMKVGTCISPYMISQANTEKLILAQFNSITMENNMKPDYVLNQERSQAEGHLVVEYQGDTLKILKWAKTHNLAMRGHTLIWYSQTPEWIFHEGFNVQGAYVDRDEMLLRMEDLIRGTFEELERLEYLDLFYAFDVVNEAWMEDGSLRPTLWSEIIGEDYLWYAFYYADQYAPESVDLYYNDYNAVYKAAALVKMAQSLVDEGGRSLIDGIGLQAHLFTADDLTKYFAAVDQLAETGIKLELTEIDVGLGKYQSAQYPSDTNLRAQGRFFYELIGGLFERADAGKINMDAVTFWGFSDGLSWRKEYSPQLYDEELNPKYALYGAMQIKEYAGY